MPDPALSLPITVAPETPDDAPAIERLEGRAFGPGRFARTVYRLRDAAAPDPALCFVARVGTLLVGSNRVTPILAGPAPALLLGPLAVEPAFRRRGIARALVEAALRAAMEAGHKLVLLVGDAAYYERFGFARVPPGRLVLPGPVDPARLLVRELVPGAFEGAAGAVSAPT